MIDAVKTAFKERLDKNDWIDDTTRQASKDKVDAITKMVAYPDEISNTTYLNDLYAEVSERGIGITVFARSDAAATIYFIARVCAAFI